MIHTGWQRLAGLALLASCVLALAYADLQPRRALPADTPATAFSSARAEAVLARVLGAEKPHPVGSAENAAVRARILAEFASLGVTAKTYSAFTCNPWRHLSYLACATVTDIVADVMPGSGKAIVLMAHYDSVPAGPGASDDESGVATVLETVRALKARGETSLHPVIALITDGEEGGLLGANAFLQNPALKARVGAVVNVEARGTSGQSLLFQTSPGDARLIDLYARSVPVPATSSLYAEIYRFLPNDTDLTLFIKAGFTSFNFAFVQDVRYYHSPFDTRADLSPATLQMHGDNLLGVVSALEQTPYASLRGPNAIYASVFGLFLPRMPAAWALPVSVVLLLLVAIAGWRLRRDADLHWPEAVGASFAPPLLLLACGLAGWGLSLIAQRLSGHGDPSYAFPFALRAALGLAVWAVAIFCSRLASVQSLTLSVWLWFAVLGVLTAAFLPGVSPYFLFPTIIAAPLLLLTAPGGWSDRKGQAALIAGAVAALLLWFPVASAGETLMGLRIHPLFTLPAAFGVLSLLPLLSGASHRARISWAVASAAAALAVALVAGLQPAYSAKSPQRINFVYLEHEVARARFIADTAWKGSDSPSLPLSIGNAAPFHYDPDAWSILNLGDGFVADGGRPQFPLPEGSITADRMDGDRRVVTLHLSGSSSTDRMALHIPVEAKLRALSLRGQQATAETQTRDTYVICLSPDCRELDVTLTLASRDAVDIPFAEIRQGLPPSGSALQAARPPLAMASQSGDETVLADVIHVPAAR